MHDTSEAPAIPKDERARLRRATWILGLILLVATSYHWHFGGGWNVMTRLALVRAVIHDGSLSINRSHTRTGDKAEYPPGSGNYYCDKPVGPQILGVAGYLPAWALGNAAGLDRAASLNAGAVAATWAAVALPTILVCLLLLRLFLALGLTLRQASFSVLAYALGTLAWPYATVLYGHQTAAAFAMLAFLAAFYALRGNRTAALSFLAGLLAGGAVIAEFPALSIAGILFLYLWPAGGRARVAYLLGGIGPIALQLAYNQACFDSPFRFAYSYEVDPAFANPAGWVSYPRLGALWGITFSADKGIFFLSPFLLFGLWGLWRMIRGQWRREGLAWAGIVACYLAYNAGHYMWEGGVCYGPRHLVNMLPFLAAGAALAWPGLGATARRVYLALAGWSVLGMFAAVSTLAEPAYRMLTGKPGPLEAFVRLSYGIAEWYNAGIALGLPPALSFATHAAVLVGLAALLWRETKA